MKIALVENLTSDFIGARLRFAIYLKKRNIDVTAIVPKDNDSILIKDMGIKVIEYGDNVRGKGLLNKIAFAYKLIKIFKSNHFDIIHLYRLQPNLIGSFIAGISTKSKIINHVTGLGYAFSNNSLPNLIIQKLTILFYNLNFKLFNTNLIYQNEYDKYDLHIFRNSVCIPGSAVNEDLFNVKKISENKTLFSKKKKIINDPDKLTFLFVSRLIKEKGIIELINAFNNLLFKENISFNLLIVGWSDPQNPKTINENEIEKLISKNKFIKFLGKRSDIADLISISDICILPSYYREGTPRFLLESMCLGKPIITTKMPGCSHLIKNDKNGIIIQPRSILEIENAIKKISNLNIKKMGAQSKNIYIKCFSEKVIYSLILNYYNSVIDQII